MSWSISFLGRPEQVAQAIESYSDKLDGQSKVEYDDAKLHLAALVRQNFGDVLGISMLRIDASGYGQAKQVNEGQPLRQVQRYLTLKIENLYATVV